MREISGVAEELSAFHEGLWWMELGNEIEGSISDKIMQKIWQED
jgi:hypothetical protein